MILELKQLKTAGTFHPTRKTNGFFMDDDLKVKFEAWNEESHFMLKLEYKTTDYWGKPHQFSFWVEVEKRKSNLGHGEILYFICPYCDRPCRKLFKVNYCINFKCRKCYSTLPYPTQNSSKMYRANSKFFNVERTLERLYKMRQTGTYKGRMTKRARRIQMLENKLQEYDYQRLRPESMPLSLRRAIYGL